MYEKKGTRPISKRAFRRRVIWHLTASLVVITCALGIGVFGYHLFGSLDWVDSLYNASMILGGMGPAAEIQSVSGKLFASFYALFSGLVFISLVAIMLTPFAHRMLHSFHWDEG